MNSMYFNQKNKRKVSGPTVAVIRYDDNKGEVPTVVAHGSGQVAQKIMELAKQNNIQMQEDESLVGALLNIDLGESIPPQLYAVMAEILILLEELDQSY
ncbi:EscU/YscU/HrcU family type III secretion system export apparatus switch protein [Peribacillus asahii]|uniref:EscU/YscU/HrcU family type III secretion system export apparatus switch protein n=1 Tax=Peribacillus asahii TaxID=228899 RepID=UPI0020798DB2|nr:EscU/YscU/HrcU family type III secretion system export apparatus switch protein [Peribacillus asahii]USK72573.1 EscU/YscU/HrcU family type III secretion system export apparatus switch protein [Peribacillus asahii]